MPGFWLNVSVMPINVSVIYSLAERKSFPYWFKYLNATTWHMYEMTAGKNDPERVTCKRKEGIQANANKKNIGIIILVIDKAFFVSFPFCFVFNVRKC